MPMVEVNFLAVTVAAVLYMMIGFVWYSPGVLGESWMKAAGKTKHEIGKTPSGKMRNIYLLTFIGALVMSYVLAIFIFYIHATSFSQGVQVGFWLWVGFVATTSSGSYLFEGRSPKIYIINNGYNLLALMMMGALLAVFS